MEISKIITLFNQDISEQDLPLVHKSEKGIQLSIEGPVYLGSTEWMKENSVSDASQNNYVDSLELPSGNYVVNVYSLLMNDASGKPEFIQFVFSIISESKFVNKGEQLHTATQPISLKYSA